MKYLSLYENFKVPTILYHGSPNKFDHFSFNIVGETSNMLEHGYGIYLTDSIKSARNYSKGGYVYDIKLDNSINLINWNKTIDQKLIDIISKFAIENKFIEKLLLDEINNVDISTKHETGTISGFISFSEKHGSDKLQLYRLFSNVVDTKYPLSFEDLYLGLTDNLFNGNMKECSLFFKSVGIDGTYYKETDVYYTVYTIYNLDKIHIINSIF